MLDSNTKKSAAPPEKDTPSTEQLPRTKAAEKTHLLCFIWHNNLLLRLTPSFLDIDIITFVLPWHFFLQLQDSHCFYPRVCLPRTPSTFLERTHPRPALGLNPTRPAAVSQEYRHRISLPSVPRKWSQRPQISAGTG